MTRDIADYPIPNVRGLKLAVINVVVIPKHHDKLTMLRLNKSIDTLAINETRPDKQIMDSEVDIDGYHIMRKDRNRSGGGVALYIRSLNYKVRHEIDPFDLEILTVEINKPKSKPLLVTTWYWPHPKQDQLKNYELHLSKLDDEDKESIILGDTNWNL